MSEEFLKVAALGRPFTLGMLYDARQDELIPGFTLWDKTTLQENTTETSNPSSEFQITACDSIESKSTLLDVDASLKASFLAAELMSDISVGLVRKAEDALEGIREIKMRCNDSLEDKVSEDFPEIRKTLSTFQKLCNNFTSALQQTMKKTFPSIREGEEDESSLKKLFEDRDKSPFSQDKLSKWMDHKEREITVIRSCVDMMEGTNTKIVKNQSELDREVFDPDVKNTLCFVFTSVESVDPCLDAMADYLDSPEIRSTNEDHWYFSDEVLMRMREKAKAFHDLAESLKESSSVCFLVTATANEKYKGATIYHYKEGKLVTDDFSKPDVPPDVETITDKSALIWYACDLSLDPNTVNYDLILSDNDKKVTHGARQEYPDHPGRFDNMSSDTMTVAALGRPFTLGMLYDAWQDKLIPESST
eukprot:superscaffoldBa00005007_g19771